MLGTIIKIFLVAFVVYSLVDIVVKQRDKLNIIWTVWKRFRIKMFFECLFVIVLTIIGMVFLIKYVPFLKYGWLSIIYGGMGGNIIARPIIEGSESSFSLVRWLVPVFFFFLLISLPILAKIEEEWFRKGKYRRGEIIVNSIKFGFIHLIVGVPIAAGVVLSGVGFFYAVKYKKAHRKSSRYLSRYEAEEEAVLASTTYHALYNSILVSFLIFVSVLSAI